MPSTLGYNGDNGTRIWIRNCNVVIKNVYWIRHWFRHDASVGWANKNV
jgi:hypothetical protein